uniref:Uncharacterized protein n=1 Tax=Pyxicephalus adspersus TaxID=30357 RepID=A0AAV3A000_PYXAD|nr:TPA: hypothetical protein GDO54_002480 [Pyxicephalus adspersus]
MYVVSVIRCSPASKEDFITPSVVDIVSNGSMFRSDLVPPCHIHLGPLWGPLLDEESLGHLLMSPAYPLTNPSRIAYITLILISM